MIASTDSRSVASAYAHCLTIARGHYENFPVASVLMPRRIRGPVAAIYAFARHADDLADEGDATPEERLTALADYEANLDRLNEATDPVFVALAHSIETYRLPIELLHDLITAFRQDVTIKRFATHERVLTYCRYSANPVGRLLLTLMGKASEENLSQSDCICSALQLINFLQDIQQDLQENDRVYIPQDQMRELGISKDDLREARNTPQMQQLIKKQVRQTRELLLCGAPLALAVGGRFGLELRATVLGGLRVLYRLEIVANPFSRPRLGLADWIWIGWNAIIPGAYRTLTRSSVSTMEKAEQ